MKLAPFVTLGLVNGVLAILLFAGALVALGVLAFDARGLTAGAALLPLLLSSVGPAMLVISLIAGIVSSLARKSRASAHLVGMIVAGCLGCGLITQGRAGIGAALGTMSLVQLALVASLALPWALGAGWFRVAGKPA